VHLRETQAGIIKKHDTLLEFAKESLEDFENKTNLGASHHCANTSSVPLAVVLFIRPDIQCHALIGDLFIKSTNKVSIKFKEMWNKEKSLPRGCGSVRRSNRSCGTPCRPL